MKLKKGERVITAYAERASGPGWANAPIWVIIRNVDGSLRQTAIQPDGQTAAMQHLYGVSEQAHLGMTSEARMKLERRT